MKVGILTLHYGFNEGAILQAMAMTRLTESVLPGARAEIVDHRYPGKQAVYGPPNTPREIAISRAINGWLPLSTTAFCSCDAQATNEYCRQHYDAVVVGSDVVWNLRYTGYFRRWLGRGIFRRQRDPFFPPFPNVYWPTSTSSSTRIAYAASCGNLCPDDVPRSHRREMTRRLLGFAGIGVRDERTRDFVRGLSAELAAGTEIVPDPTIAFDLLGAFDGSAALHKLFGAGYVAGERYALLIMKEGPLSSAVARHLRQRGWRLVATGPYGGMADVNLVELGLSPLEWAWVSRQFRLCITERMHASIYCLLNHTVVLGLDMNRREPDTQTKLQELFSRTGLSDAYLHQDLVDADSVCRWLDARLGYRVEWDRVDTIFEGWRATARDFLSRSLT